MWKSCCCFKTISLFVVRPNGSKVCLLLQEQWRFWYFSRWACYNQKKTAFSQCLTSLISCISTSNGIFGVTSYKEGIFRSTIALPCATLGFDEMNKLKQQGWKIPSLRLGGDTNPWEVLIWFWPLVKKRGALIFKPSYKKIFVFNTGDVLHPSKLPWFSAKETMN